MSLQFYVHVTLRAYNQDKVSYIRKTRIPAVDLTDANQLCHMINDFSGEWDQARRHAVVVIALHSSMGMTYITLQDAEFLASELNSIK